MTTENTNRLIPFYLPESNLRHFVKSLTLDKQGLLASFLNALSEDEFAQLQNLTSSTVAFSAARPRSPDAGEP
ncbi:MAG TPA: hypothetical protein VMV37_12845 [Gammaproteobacteria bacterium]|nr:hypothetical protein [Gammaproteobacteria bacterium]